ncbi:MAG TPA: hypothetical protein VGZ27_09590 [Vicinamibacterales bacterium]|jgi:hypothetical protein|nr:hypothetical protein [Vicinamibacterales bacterium]
MKPVWWMAGASVVSALAASAALGGALEVWLGMIAPLVAVCGSWIAAARTYDRHPERLTSIMMTAFVGKLVLFGAYVWLALGVLRVRPQPFVLSFAVYFIALYAAEAVCLQRLFAERMHAS